MHKQSMRWKVIAAVGALASHAVAQTATSGSSVSAPAAAPNSGPSLTVAPVPPQNAAGTQPASSPLAPPSGTAEPSTGEASGSLSVQTSTANATTSPAQSNDPAGAVAAESTNEKPWIEQLLPVDNSVEIGAFTGLFFPSGSLNLQSEAQRHQGLAIAPALGVRGAYFPLKYVGAELEYAAAFSKSDDDTQSTLWALRGHVIGQFPAWRVTPFALVGLGRLGVISNALGNDGDPLFHFGVGAKAALTPSLSVRFDLRDDITQKHAASNGTGTHSIEALIGISLVLGRETPSSSCANSVLDTDNDGLVDRVDRCPTEAGAGADGCPLKDTDEDGVTDDKDKCPEVKGSLPDGCPEAKSDTDGDGVADDADKCPALKGDAPDGCPSDRDSDSDGIIDSKDRCPTQAESRNGFEDDDGCPDELPTQVKEFTGVLNGIEFDRDKASIRPASIPALDKSAQVLATYPSLRVLITGHTDDTGNRPKNLQLSKDRAEAVKAHFVSKGIDAGRIQTRGAGSEEPIDSNATAAGRQRNRRIELKLLKDEG